jgi:hypothetical protein
MSGKEANMASHGSDRFQRAAAAVLERARSADGQVLRHDPADPDQVAYLEELAQLHGYGPERYPALFASFRKGTSRLGASKNGQGNTGAFSDNQIVDYLAPLRRSGLASAHGLVTRISPVARAFVALSIMNVDGAEQTVVASGVADKFLRQTAEVQTNDGMAEKLPATGQNWATLTWVIEYADGSTESSYQTGVWGFQTSADPAVTDPAVRPDRRKGDLGNIMIGLARGSGSNEDVDYWFWQEDPLQRARPMPTLLVPLSGSMFFSKPIAPLSKANPQLRFYLSRMEGGMSVVPTTDAKPYMPCFSIDENDPRRLNFTLRATGSGAGNAINFGISPWVADTQTFFIALVFVTLDDNSMGWSTICSSAEPDANPADGVAYIKPIKFVWHCVAAGTQVTMADGATRNIEDLDAGAAVLGANGTTQRVQATLAAPHWGPVVIVRTRGGLSLTCSTTHPVMTPRGLVQAAALQPGASVQTAQGTDQVASTSQQEFNGGGLFNLWLAAPEGSTYYANGIEVGDYQAQTAPLEDTDPGAVRARLPEHLRADFDSHLAQTRAGLGTV